MGFSLPIARVKNDEIDKAISDSRQGQRYTGPTPPPGVYRAKIKKVFTKETKTGKAAINVLFEINETGDNEVYNGAGIFNMYLIPSDPSEKAFPYQISNLDSMIHALSNGTMGYKEFQEAALAEKVVLKDPQKYDPSKNNEITKIGTLKITGEAEANIKLKMDEYNGKERAILDFIVEDKVEKKAKAADYDDDPFGETGATGSDDSDADFNDWLNEG